MLAFKVTLRNLGFNRKLRRAMRLFKDLKPEMEIIGKFVLWDARKRLAARNSESSIGRLGKSLKFTAYKLAVVISSVLAYARIQQEGGRIVPRKRKALAIPLQPDLKRKHTWPKHYTGKSLKLVRIDDVLWEFKKVGTNQSRRRTGRFSVKVVVWERVRAAFVLKRSVTLKGRPYLVKSKELLTLLRKLIVKRFDKWKKEAA